MGVLIDGKWTDGELPQETGETGEFKRVDSVFRDRITADGSSGFKAEPGRYHLYVAHGCPWAHRTLIYRALKKLDGADHGRLLDPGPEAAGLDVRERPGFPDCTPDTVNGFHYPARGLYGDRSELHRQGHGADAVGQEDQDASSTTSCPRSSGCSTASSTRITGDHTDYYPQASARRDRRHQRAHLPQRQQRRVSLRLRQVAGGLRGGLRRAVRDARRAGGAAVAASAIWSATRSPRPTGGCFRRWCASTSPISRSSSATGSASPTIRTCRTTCASSTRCRASPRP